MSRGYGYEEWALNEMDELGMNEYEYCNYKGYNIADILKDDYEDDEDQNENDSEDW